MFYIITLLNTFAIVFYTYKCLYKIKENKKEKLCIIDSINLLNEEFYSKLELNNNINLYYIEIKDFEETFVLSMIYDNRNKFPLMIKSTNDINHEYNNYILNEESMYEVFISEIC